MKLILFLNIFLCVYTFGQNTNSVYDKEDLLEELRLYEIKNNDSLIISSTKKLAEFYLQEFHFDSALFFGKKCDNLLKKNNLPRYEVENNITLGIVYNVLKKYDSSLYYFNKTDYLYQINDTLDKSFLILNQIKKEHLYFDNKEYLKALKTLNKAVKYSSKYGVKKHSLLISSNFSHIYYELEQYDSAVISLKKTIKFQTEKSGFLAYNYYMLFRSYLALNDSNNAFLHAKKGLAISSELNIKNFENLFHIDIADFLLNQNREKAKEELKKVHTNKLEGDLECLYLFVSAKTEDTLTNKLNLCNESLQCTNDKYLKSELYYYMYEILKDTNKNKALLYLEKYNYLRDSLKDNKLQIENAILSNKLEKNITEINNHKVKSKKNIYVIIILCIFFILITYLIYKQYNKQRKKNIELNEDKVILLRETKKINKELSSALFEIEKNITFIKNSKKELSEIRAENRLDSKLNNLYVRVNQYISDINRNNELQERITKIKDEIFDKIDSDIKLTKTERKLIMLIRLDMTSKEIAPLLNVTENSVEKYRYRLRKKINIDKNSSLREYCKSL